MGHEWPTLDTRRRDGADVAGRVSLEREVFLGCDEAGAKDDRQEGSEEVVGGRARDESGELSATFPKSPMKRTKLRGLQRNARVALACSADHV